MGWILFGTLGYDAYTLGIKTYPWYLSDWDGMFTALFYLAAIL